MEEIRSKERGQAIVLLAVALIVLLGFTALAVDGGMIYSDRRNAQNAADSAALAGALQKANSKSNTDIRNAAIASATVNGYLSGHMNVTISPFIDFSGRYTLVTVVITSTPETSFVHLFYGGQIRNVVTAIARVRQSQPAFPGSALVAMGDCTKDNNDVLIGVSGGGNNGGVMTFKGGMFVNAPEDEGDACAIDPPNSNSNGGITVDQTCEEGDPYCPHGILSVGNETYSDDHDFPNMSPRPVQTNINGHAPISDPLADILEEPICNTNGTKTGSGPNTIYTPGRYGGSGQLKLGEGYLEHGIYCITGDIDASGSETIDATSGVLLYFINGKLDFSGNANFVINAPGLVPIPGDEDNSTCLGSSGDRTASCNYVGIAIFSARNNTSIHALNGNGEYQITGLVYALNGGIQAGGGGTAPDEYIIKGQVIASHVLGNGNGTFTITYDAGSTYTEKTRIALHK